MYVADEAEDASIWLKQNADTTVNLFIVFIHDTFKRDNSPGEKFGGLKISTQ